MLSVRSNYCTHNTSNVRELIEEFPIDKTMKMVNSSINNESQVLFQVGKIRTPEGFSSDVPLAHSKRRVQFPKHCICGFRIVFDSFSQLRLLYFDHDAYECGAHMVDASR